MVYIPYVAPATVDQLITGHFVERERYAVWRQKGTYDWLLILTLAGAGRFGYPGGDFIATAGELVLLRPHTRHDYSLEPHHRHWELLWVHFFPVIEWQRWLYWPEEAPGLMRLPLDVPSHEALGVRLMEVHTLATGSARNRIALASNALERFLLWCDEINPLAAHGALDHRIRRAVDYLGTHYHESVTLSSLSHRCQLSVSRLAHLFREQVGVTPGKFLEAQRLYRAKQLLVSTQLPVAKVAYSVGFDNPYYFSRRFKRNTGLSPKVYRQRFLR